MARSAQALSPLGLLPPEEEELFLKKEELSRLEQELAERELCLSTLKGELHLFEQQYNQIVGIKYAELDDVRAQILELAARFNPESAEIRKEAESAREHARQSSRETGWTREEPQAEPIQDFRPSESLKKLFREAAKKIHPDLATAEEDRARRHRLMADLNQAYDHQDEGRIRQILAEWESGKDSDAAKSAIGLQLVQCIRKISQVRQRLQKIRDEQEELENSEMYRLRERIERQGFRGRDIMQEMAVDIEEKIARVKSKVRLMADELTYL